MTTRFGGIGWQQGLGLLDLILWNIYVGFIDPFIKPDTNSWNFSRVGMKIICYPPLPKCLYWISKMVFENGFRKWNVKVETKIEYKDFLKPFWQKIDKTNTKLSDHFEKIFVSNFGFYFQGLFSDPQKDPQKNRYPVPSVRGIWMKFSQTISHTISQIISHTILPPSPSGGRDAPPPEEGRGPMCSG